MKYMWLLCMWCTVVGWGGGGRGGQMLGKKVFSFLEIIETLYSRTSMGEDVTAWIECSDTESDDDTTDSEEEWHEVKDQGGKEKRQDYR